MQKLLLLTVNMCAICGNFHCWLTQFLLGNWQCVYQMSFPSDSAISFQHSMLFYTFPLRLSGTLVFLFGYHIAPYKLSCYYSSYYYSNILKYVVSTWEYSLYSSLNAPGLQLHKITLQIDFSRSACGIRNVWCTLQVHGKRFVYKFVCDLTTTIGYSPADIQRLIALSAAETELSQSVNENQDSATMKLERLRELLRTPGAVRRADTRTISTTVPVVVAPEDLIVDGTSWMLFHQCKCIGKGAWSGKQELFCGCRKAVENNSVIASVKYNNRYSDESLHEHCKMREE